ncbi:hypothetical protein COEREDRAFT_78926 [Coemansia reversa NRRL 1564]|uniref:Bromodomain associated domain-containing protein n=1 Tax=Coemansia reversa (strain ATCC 12441 / NRRL 1564) TaxID=763665 RepID=A0A2G5BKV5_COERN|nr:hypothetical protein COEREDRAFT_78926 [Coemansia reversa NRRL 1564]|eukprot:PIA19602.1 hypothetical protein COEREDRAFT_78926 [Coemansia reversa NRRL 1564]
MSKSVASSIAGDRHLSNSCSDHRKVNVQSPGPMAGILMSTHHAENSVDQLSSQKATSPYHYSSHKDDIVSVSDARTLQRGTFADMNANTVSNADTLGIDRGPTNQQLLSQDISRTPDTRVAGMAHTGIPGKSNGTNGRLAYWNARERASAQMSKHLEGRSAHKRRIQDARTTAKPHKPLVNSRLFSSVYSSDPTHSHYEKAMRRSAHHVVAATTLFDSVSSGALAILADIARLYLMRLGEACKARADLANRTEPNIYDLLDSDSLDLSVDLDALQEWVDDWKTDVGEVVNGATSKTRDSIVSATNNGLCSMAGVNNGAVGHDDMDTLTNGLDLHNLMFDWPNMVDNIDGIIPAHLPPLVPLSDHSDTELPEHRKDETADIGASLTPPTTESHTTDNNRPPLPDADGTPVAASTPNGNTSYTDGMMSPESDNEETPESVAAHMLHLASSSLSRLNPQIGSNKALSAFFQPSSKLDPTCNLNDIIPSFEVPDSGFVSASEVIQNHLSHIEKLEPGSPMFLINDSAQRDALGDSEVPWRQARDRLYSDMYDAIAAQAVEEMNNAPVPMRRRRISNAFEDKDSDADDDEEAMREHKKESLVEQRASGDRERTIENANHDDEHVHESDVDISIDADVMDIDMDMGMDIDIDLGVDAVNGFSEARASQNDGYSAEKQTTFAPKEDDEDEYLEPVALPISNGLRGSGVSHWSNEWFSAAMAKRLSTITAQDITPCDSLFLSNPSTNQRNVVDEVARAFVDSEGGGHLHETTPIEGFGPSANTYTVPTASGSALRWVLHHIMQTKGVKTVDSLYTGRSSLAGGVSGDGVSQYVTRMCSLIRGSAEEEAELVVSGAIRRANDRIGTQWADRKINPGVGDLMEQLVSGAEKRIPWAQERFDIHVLESHIAGRPPQPAVVKPEPVVNALVAPTTPSIAPATSPSATPVSEHGGGDNNNGPGEKFAEDPLEKEKQQLSSQEQPQQRITEAQQEGNGDQDLQQPGPKEEPYADAQDLDQPDVEEGPLPAFQEQGEQQYPAHSEQLQSSSEVEQEQKPSEQRQSSLL